ncbi:MAG: hypothetical protein ACHQFW_07740, partial [Chitinophagales bacterium]
MLQKLLLRLVTYILVISLFPLKNYAQTAVDVEVTNAGPLQYVVPGKYAVIPTVVNNDIDNSISYMDLNWQIDGGIIHSCFIDDFMLGYTDLYPTFKSRIIHSDSITFTTTGAYVLKIWS